MVRNSNFEYNTYPCPPYYLKTCGAFQNKFLGVYILFLISMMPKDKLYPILDTRISVRLSVRVWRSQYPPWILKLCWLESFSQRLISLNDKTKIIAFFAAKKRNIFKNFNFFAKKYFFGFFKIFFGFSDF